MSEIPFETVCRAAVFVDHREAALHEAGDIVDPMRRGRLTPDFATAELGPPKPTPGTNQRKTDHILQVGRECGSGHRLRGRSPLDSRAREPRSDRRHLVAPHIQQELRGHSDVSTTIVSTHVLAKFPSGSAESARINQIIQSPGRAGRSALAHSGMAAVHTAVCKGLRYRRRSPDRRWVQKQRENAAST